MSEVVRLSVRPFPGRLLTKRQLASGARTSTRWIELRMRRGYACRSARRATRACALRSDGSSRMALHSRSATPRLPLEQRVERLERDLSTLAAELKRGSRPMSIRKRGNKFTVKVYDPKTSGNQRWIGTFATEEEARDAERAATAGITPAARARTVGEWSSVWLRDYARSAPATRRNVPYAAEADRCRHR